MKRAFLLLLCMLLLVPVASAEIDLSGMSFEELVALKDQINKAIWESEEWQEVEVPQGVWVIGEDIPVGKWTIKAVDGIEVRISWGDKLDDSGTSITYSPHVYVYETLTSEDYRYYKKDDMTEVTWDLKEGQYLVVEDGIAVFTPYAGKPSLGFK